MWRKTMTAKELIEYLQMFDQEAIVSFCTIDPERRLDYEIKEILMITDMREPCIVSVAGEAGPLETDEGEERDEQMDD